MFPPPGFPLPGQVMLLTDQLFSPADFMLQDILHTQLKSRSGSKCIILSVSDDIGRWKSIASKVNLNLVEHIKSGSLVFVDVMSFLPTTGPFDTLKPLCDHIKKTIEGVVASAPSKTLIILDDVSALQWIGFPFIEISRLLRSLCSICRKSNISLVMRHHVVESDDLDDLSRHLLQLCTYHMEVLALSSGRSGAVSGEVALHSGASNLEPEYQPIPRQAAVQYRLSDSSAVFFERGTGGGVL